ncbi:MAG: ATP-grasp domain-containing protein [Ectothiorhodospiraceae bacterium]|nr:ATP-grasp domain-containing protein [Chromatiales bacterium]MCP5153486.1 ATP-grasp domain-containing protein [Ectothiorhodospiraceae bacterium]
MKRSAPRAADPGGSGGRHAVLVAPPGSYRIAAYLEAAAGLGIAVTVVSEGEHSLTPAIASGIAVDLSAPRQAASEIVGRIGHRPVDAVVATDDRTVEIAAEIGARFGLEHNPPDAARATRRKDLARARLREAGVRVPWSAILSLDAPLEDQTRRLIYPCVVKPLAMSASRGVIRADDPAALLTACRRVERIIAGEREHEERRRVLVEGFVPGPEVALEGMLERGGLRVLAVFDKPDPLDGPFFEETYYVTPSRLPAACIEAVVEETARACRALGLRTGPVHAELRVGAGGPWVIEVAARTIGGDCARLLRFGTGHSLEALVLAQAVGLPLETSSEHGGAGVLMIPTPAAGTLRRVEGVLDASRIPGIEEVSITVREGYELVPLPEGASYLGFVFARAASAADAEAALRAAHAAMRVVVAPLWRIEPAAVSPSLLAAGGAEPLR